jgi:hypothetical protein
VAPPAPVVPAAPAAPAPVAGGFKLSEKEYQILRNSNPRYEWKILLKNFFNEMSLTTYGRIPAQFIKDVNALGIRGTGTAAQIDKLQSLISAYKPSVAPEAVPEKKTKTLVKASDVRKKEGRKAKSLVAVKKTKVKKLPKPDKVKKPKRTKVPKKKSTKKLVDEIVVYS